MSFPAVQTAAAAPPVQPAAWAVLRNPLFRALWVANVVSGIGTALHTTAASWTIATISDSPALVTLMQTMASLPLFLFGLVAGAVADIVDRRKVVLGAQVASLVVAATLTFLAWTGHLTPATLLSATFLLGLGVAFTVPTWQAILAEIVPRKDLPAALTLGSVSVNISRAIGPIIGGLLLAVAGPPAAFALNAVSFLGIIFVLWRWQGSPEKTGARTERMRGAIAAALRFTRHSPPVKAVLLRSGTFVFFGIAPIALLPVIVRDHRLGAADFGMLVSAFGIGGIFAAFVLLPKLRARFSADQLVAGATLLFAVAVALLTLEKHSWSLALVLFLAGTAWLTYLSTVTVAAQSAFPDWVRARSSAIQLITLQAAWAAGAWAWGWIAEHWTASLALRVAAAGVFLTLILAKHFPLGPAMRLDVTPSRHWREHNLAHEPAEEDGPVLVTIDYTVDPENAQRFLDAIANLRPIRLRDGAFRWSVFQDLNDTHHFRESFLVGSWGEHLHQHERATVEDQRVEQAVESFHLGPEPPRVSHYLMKNVSL